jgi:hypothetical protein
VQRLTCSVDQHSILPLGPSGHVLHRSLPVRRLVFGLMVMQAIEHDVARLRRHLFPTAAVDRTLDCSPCLRFALVVVFAPAVAASSPGNGTPQWKQSVYLTAHVHPCRRNRQRAA